MTLEIAGWIAAAIGALLGGGGVVAVFTARAQRRKLLAEAARTGADTATVLSSTAVSLLEPMRLEIDRLQKKVNTLEAQVDQMSRRLERAQQVLNEHGISAVVETPPAGMNEYRRRGR